MPAAEPAAPPQTQGLHFIVVDKPDAVQTQIRVGNLGIRRDDPDYIPLVVTNRIFGGGYNSRLNTEVRIKKGLTYGANSSFEAERFAGEFVADTYTRTEATAEATKLVVDLISQMSSGDVKPEELKFAQDYLSGVYPIQSETAAQVAGRVLAVAEYGLAPDYNDTYQQKILGVDESSVKQMATRYFNSQNLDVVLVGNASQFLPAVKAEFPGAQWQEIPFNELDLLSPNLRQAKSEAPAATPESLQHGQEVVMAAARAAGGDSLRSVSTLEFSQAGNIYSAQGTLAISIKWQIAYPNKSHAVLTLPMGQLTQTTDGKSAWIQSPQGTREVPADAFGEFQRGINLFGGWGLYQQALAGGVKAQYVGQENTADGKNAEVVNWLGVVRHGQALLRLSHASPGRSEVHVHRHARFRRSRPALERLPRGRRPPVPVPVRDVSQPAQNSPTPPCRRSTSTRRLIHPCSPNRRHRRQASLLRVNRPGDRSVKIVPQKIIAAAVLVAAVSRI